MSASQKTTSDVLAFLDHLENKAIVPKNTIVGRKVAAKKFFDGLEPSEQTVGFIDENFDLLYERFKNRNSLAFKGNSLEVYGSRVKNILQDFLHWSSDPGGWERSLNSKKTSTKPTEKKTKQKPQSPSQDEPTKHSHQETNASTRKLTFPIAPGVEVKVEFPIDGLTTAELSRLGMFLFPYCKDLSTERWENVKWPMVPSNNH